MLNLNDAKFVKVLWQRSTEKAIEVVVISSGISKWLPKSQIALFEMDGLVNGYNKRHVAAIPEWMFNREGREVFAGQIRQDWALANVAVENGWHRVV